MSQKEKVDPVLRWFRSQMRRKLMLPKNLKKSFWGKMLMDDLLTNLQCEVGELDRALREPPTDEEAVKIINECADVANFAMMIADNARNYITGRGLLSTFRRTFSKKGSPHV